MGQAITNFTMAATGGTTPYTWTDPGTTLPPGVTVASGGLVSGTPTTANTYNVTLTVTDAASPTPATDTASFTFTVNAAPVGVTPIADIQGTGATSPLDGQVVNTEGVVTARVPDRRPQRLLHPDPRRGHRQRLGRDLRLRRRRWLHDLPGDR